MNEYSNQNGAALNTNNSHQNLNGIAGNLSATPTIATPSLNSSSSQFLQANNNLNNNSSLSSNSNSIMRDSVSSFQSYILSSNNTPSSPVDRSQKPNRNKFRNIAQISSMFANYSTQTRPTNVRVRLFYFEKQCNFKYNFIF
jgi:hypothetical protein